LLEAVTYIHNSHHPANVNLLAITGCWH